MNKKELLIKFRDKAFDYLEEIEASAKGFKEKAAELNKKINQYRRREIELFLQTNSTDREKLNSILLITYVSYVVMLEFRNKVWQYDYMTFSRRIGELWEPFCILPFEYPVNELRLYIPPNIDDVKKTLKSEVDDLVGNLAIESDDKKRLLKYYQAIWSLIDNGGNISLTLDLHFKQYELYYDVDYKSGFSSNEKGNTNRLLLVASIYKSLPEKHNNLIFVRQKEEQNNHYLQTLKNSGLWDVYCADEAYAKINEFTGFDIRKWMTNNMDWNNDIDLNFKKYLKSNELLKYLTW